MSLFTWCGTSFSMWGRRGGGAENMEDNWPLTQVTALWASPRSACALMMDRAVRKSPSFSWLKWQWEGLTRTLSARPSGAPGRGWQDPACVQTLHLVTWAKCQVQLATGFYGWLFLGSSILQLPQKIIIHKNTTLKQGGLVLKNPKSHQPMCWGCSSPHACSPKLASSHKLRRKVDFNTK